MLSILLTILVIVIVAGAIAWIVQSAPFIVEPMKGWAVWLICAVALILIIVALVGAVGGGSPLSLRL